MSEKLCPSGHGPMVVQKTLKPVTFRDVALEVPVTEHVCRECGFSASDVTSAAAVQQEIAEAYRQRTGLLTGGAIRTMRRAKRMTQASLAEKMGVGIASIKRWEKANVQSESMDKLLRTCLMDAYNGNRPLSLPRVKLVIRFFEEYLNRRLLKKTDKFLFVAKYLWYADMLAFKKLGQSMTGATYAAITYGPQLNNYRDLIDDIKQCDEFSAESLSEEEVDIIQMIANRFPEDQMVYDAAHREQVWRETPTGRMIFYTKAWELTEI